MAWHGIETHHVMDVAWHGRHISFTALVSDASTFPSTNQPTNEFRKHHKLTNRNLRPHSIHSAFSQTHSRIHTHRPAGNGVTGHIVINTVIVLHHPIGVRRARSLQQSPICLVDVSAFQGACVAPFWSLRIFPPFNCLVKSP